MVVDFLGSVTYHVSTFEVNYNYIKMVVAYDISRTFLASVNFVPSVEFSLYKLPSTARIQVTACS